MKYKNVRFEYYEVVFKNKMEKSKKVKLFDLVRWINKANGFKKLSDRTYDFFTEKARLEQAYFDTSMNYYFLHFVRLGDNIPSKGTLDGKVVPIELDEDEYIGNEVTALYDEKHHILMLQRNRASLGPSGVESYLNKLWDKEDEEIHLRPIAPKGMFEGVRKADRFRKIHLKFAEIRGRQTAGNGALTSMLSSFGKFSGSTGEIVISAGRAKEDTLDSKTMLETIEEIMGIQESGIIKKAELHYKYTDDTAIEVVDLFAKITHDFGSFPMEKRKTLSHLAIADKMWNIYHSQNKKRKILEYLMRE